ncbi:MAG: molybdate transporter, periplasmic molybdate-binding protein [Pseudomonadota bacterium]
MNRRSVLLGGLAALCGVARPSGAGTARATGPLTVAAASDLQFALRPIAETFTTATGRPVRLVFGSSGILASQLLRGAPFGVFLSADEALVFKLADAGLTVDRGRLYAIGRLGLFVPPGSPLRADGSLSDLRAVLQSGRLGKFSMANPEHAPYGARAREALQHAGLWTAIQPHLVLGENITQAAQFAVAGRAHGGLVALSLMRSPALEGRGEFGLVPDTWHQPLRQRMVQMKTAPPVAAAFIDFLSTPAARASLARAGFQFPTP